MEKLKVCDDCGVKPVLYSYMMRGEWTYIIKCRSVDCKRSEPKPKAHRSIVKAVSWWNLHHGRREAG